MVDFDVSLLQADNHAASVGFVWERMAPNEQAQLSQ